MKNMTVWHKFAWPCVGAAAIAMCLVPLGVGAQSQAPSNSAPSGAARTQTTPSGTTAPATPPKSLPKAGAIPAAGAPEDPAAMDTKGTVLEEIVARVNDDVITRSDLDQSRQTLADDAHEQCPSCTDAEIQAKVKEQEPNLLRNLIDQSLLVQRAKDMDINVEADVVKRLDEIRQENHIDTIEDLETKIDESGMDFEDYKNNLRNQLLQQQVIRQEVSSRIMVDQADVKKYYDEHQSEFQRPEQVVLREIFVSTEAKPATADAAAVPAPDVDLMRKKAQTLLDRVRAGDDFTQLAIHFSDGSTAKQGGDLGTFERGQLAKDIEDQVFKLDRNQTAEVIQTKTGFLILQVVQRYEAGQQPLDRVEDEIMNKLFEAKLEPQLRDYLKQLRQDSFVEVKPGYVDSAAVPSTQIQEVSPGSDTVKKTKTKVAHRFLIFGKKKYPSQQGT